MPSHASYYLSAVYSANPQMKDMQCALYIIVRYDKSLSYAQKGGSYGFNLDIGESQTFLTTYQAAHACVSV